MIDVTVMGTVVGTAESCEYLDNSDGSWYVYYENVKTNDLLDNSTYHHAYVYDDSTQIHCFYDEFEEDIKIFGVNPVSFREIEV